MKFSTSKESFLTRLGIAARGVSTRSSIPALSGIHIHAGPDAITLQSSDGELGLQVRIGEGAEREGVVVLPGRLLLDIVRALPKDQLTLEYRAAEHDVEVISGSAKFHLRTLPPEDFPTLPSPSADPLKIPTQAFVETINRVARAASREETRPHLTGVLVSGDQRQLQMVATDSYRLSVKETELSESLAGTLEANVPARTLEELTRVSADVEEAEIEITALDNQVVFVVGDVVLSSRLVEGRFPNYRQLLPESYEHELTVNRQELLDVVRRISLLAQKNAPLRLAFDNGGVEISSQTPDVGEASESIPIPFKGEPLEIGFNPEYFREGLEAAESEEIVLKLISSLRPGLIQSGDFVYLVMPIRLQV